MKVLAVNSFDGHGGTAQIAGSLFDGLNARGHDCTLAVAYREGTDPRIMKIPSGSPGDRLHWACRDLGMLARRKHLPGARLPHLVAKAVPPSRAVTWYRGHEDFDFPGTYRLLEVAPEPPDILHLHNLAGNYFDLRALPSLTHRLPTVITLHDAWLLSGHCAHSLACDRWTSGCGACPDLRLYPAVHRDTTAFNWRRKRAIYARSRLHVVTPSAWLLDRVQRSILAPAAVTARVIPNGIDLRAFHPGDRRAARRDLEIAEGSFVALFVADAGRRNPWKDYATVQAAVARAATAGQEILFLCIGGEAGEQRHGQAIVRSVPYVRGRASLAQYYRAADVYLHAARADTFPTTVLEALACGTPVVATAVGGIPEQVEDCVTGFLIPPGDSLAMAARLDLLRTDAALHGRMAAVAGARAAARFDQERMIDRYLDLYAEVLEQARVEQGA